MVDFSRFKIQPEAVSMDDYTVTVHGQEYAPHEGETVYVLPIGLSFGALTALQRYQAMAAGGNIDDGDARLEGAFEELLTALADIVVGWDLTDITSEPYEQPYHNPDALRALPAGTLFHLLGLLRGISGQDAEGKPSRPRSGRGASGTKARPTMRAVR